ncbi:hypothetical protein [Hoeflea prorocentri]|uniref:Reversibly glycosylated polypeptide n=1 Tax=Hoeflea prorocentri TaxID=1922333 RepID=A0A9X3ZGA0_9HYPH|nr:hypothetical protein [Hoeflea prorocentri]MCY6379994.1 hypothetical protein [Hoeflea prorocentri]MDA5397794.1 hypothetical protein [Hoeflea prorocentri]
MQGHKKYIVSTTINAPTEAIRRFDAMKDWTLIVVGDRKTPTDYRLDNGRYLSPSDQEKLAPELSELIGWNCIQRRNLGFVLALDEGADIIATVDDDNIPYENWGSELLVGTTATMKSFIVDGDCFDPVGATEHRHLWHRGFPLQLLRTRDYSNFEDRQVHVDIQADFWDGDPDIDAVCRMEHAPDVTFDTGSFPFTSDTVSPFNSQNTFLTSEALRRYFMVPFAGRMDDIWAAYHLLHLGYKVAYAQASVRQDRNVQDLTGNLVNEFVGYENNAKMVQAINSGSYDISAYWPQRALRAYEAYMRRVDA